MVLERAKGGVWFALECWAMGHWAVEIERFVSTRAQFWEWTTWHHPMRAKIALNCTKLRFWSESAPLAAATRRFWNGKTGNRNVVLERSRASTKPQATCNSSPPPPIKLTEMKILMQPTSCLCHLKCCTLNVTRLYRDMAMCWLNQPAEASYIIFVRYFTLARFHKIW